VGNDDAAEADYGRLIELTPASAVGYVGRGLAREAKREFQAAVEDLERALRMDASEQGAALRLAWILAACPDDAIRNGPRALELARSVCEARNWQDWVALESYAVAAAELGQFDEAVTHQKTAIALAPPSERPAMDERLGTFEAKKAWRLSVDN
jgi:tetratricopeptide (TPR) repeat protein